jgi:hypothetical protein
VLVIENSPKKSVQTGTEDVPTLLRDALGKLSKGQIPVEKLVGMLDNNILEKAIKMAEEPRADPQVIINMLKQHIVTQVKQFDPFEKVLLTKGIDN